MTEAKPTAGIAQASRGRPAPATWQFVFDDLREYRGPVWYERQLTVSSEHAGWRVARHRALDRSRSSSPEAEAEFWDEPAL